MSAFDDLKRREGFQGARLPISELTRASGLARAAVAELG
jgi:hypothetical protein